MRAVCGTGSAPWPSSTTGGTTSADPRHRRILIASRVDRVRHLGSAPDVSGAARYLASLTPALTDVQVTAGGQVVPILETRITVPLQIDLPIPASEVEVRCVLDAAVVRTLPSKAGRALAGLAPVVAGADDVLLELTVGRPRRHRIGACRRRRWRGE